MTFNEQDGFSMPGSGILDPVEHSVVEATWGELFNRSDGAELLKRLGAMSIPEIIRRHPS